MKIADVDVSLSHGQYFTKRLIVVYIGMAVCCFFPILTVVMLGLQIEWEMKMTVAMVLGNAGSIAFLTVLTYIKIKNDRLKNKIKLWLADAVELKAYSRKIEERRLGFQPIATKIQVEFDYSDSHYKIESTYTVFGGYKGSVGCFNKYADRNVDILYSPKYNEVMILKD